MLVAGKMKAFLRRITVFTTMASFVSSFSRHLSIPSKLGASATTRGSIIQLFVSTSAGGQVVAATAQMQQESQEQLDILSNFYQDSKRNSLFETKRIPVIWNSDNEDSKSESSPSDYIRRNIDTVLFDCDGVLYRNMDICPGASECITWLLEQRKKVLFVTNNGGVNRRQLREKISKVLGISTLTEDQMISSSYSCAQFMKNILMSTSDKELSDISSRTKRVHVIGSAGFCEEISNSGFVVSGGPVSSDDESSPSMNRQELMEYNFPEHPIHAVAVGHDTEFTFRKLCIANNLLLRNPSALFVTTNKDSHDLVGSDQRHIPGNGCVVKALEHCSRREAINVGKPSQTLTKLLIQEHGLDPSRCLFVGDRLDTDIRFGNESGMKSLLVMTGVTSANTMIELGTGTEQEPLPHFILPYIGQMIE